MHEVAAVELSGDVTVNRIRRHAGSHLLPIRDRPNEIAASITKALILSARIASQASTVL
jgi:hypothetical protein